MVQQRIGNSCTKLVSFTYLTEARHQGTAWDQKCNIMDYTFRQKHRVHACTDSRHVCQTAQTPGNQKCLPHMPASPIWKDRKEVTDDGIAGDWNCCMVYRTPKSAGMLSKPAAETTKQPFFLALSWNLYSISSMNSAGKSFHSYVGSFLHDRDWACKVSQW